MALRITDLHCKEVICVCDGSRLGYVSDVEVSVPEGRVEAIVVPARYRFFGCLFCTQDYVVPWACIRRIGDDIILVDCRARECLRPRPKPGFFCRN